MILAKWGFIGRPFQKRLVLTVATPREPNLAYQGSLKTFLLRRRRLDHAFCFSGFSGSPKAFRCLFLTSSAMLWTSRLTRNMLFASLPPLCKTQSTTINCSSFGSFNSGNEPCRTNTCTLGPPLIPPHPLKPVTCPLRAAAFMPFCGSISCTLPCGYSTIEISPGYLGPFLFLPRGP